MARALRTDADVAARRALTRHAARQVRSALPAMALAIGLVALLLRPHVAPRALAWWIAAGVVDLIRAGLRSWFDDRRSTRGGRAPSRWWDNVNHAAFGLLWGGLGVTAACRCCRCASSRSTARSSPRSTARARRRSSRASSASRAACGSASSPKVSRRPAGRTSRHDGLR